MSSSSSNTAILNLLWARDTITKGLVLSLLSLRSFISKTSWEKRSSNRMKSFFQPLFSVILFGWYSLVFFFLKERSVLKSACVFFFVLVPLLASDFVEFGPDDPQSRFEFGAVVVCRIFHFVLELIPISAHIAISYYVNVTEFPYFLRKRIF